MLKFFGDNFWQLFWFAWCSLRADHYAFHSMWWCSVIMALMAICWGVALYKKVKNYERDTEDAD